KPDAGYVPTAIVESPPRHVKRIRREVPITAEEAAGPLPEIGDDHNLRPIVSGAGFDPCLPLTHVIRRSQVRVSVAAPNLESADLVDQKEIDHAGDRVGAVYR